MFQEVAEVMERKPNPKGVQASGKALVSDSKLRQDVSTSNPKYYNRGGSRKWEGGSFKGETAGKAVPFKKPQARVFMDGASRARNQVVRDAEIGSVARHGSKKQNFNHLLNFTYDVRDSGQRTPTSSHGHRNPRNVWSTRVHKYNKEQFLQANCQFVVQEGHDYSIHLFDPDLLVDWDWIEQVRVFSHELPSCPICLCPPVAAKMTRCGHLYCWPCMLHYLALSDKACRTCPICYEAVSKTHLKSVVAQATPCYKAGDEITMVLMQRERGSMVVVPLQLRKKHNGQPFQMKDSEEVCFAKLVLATNEHVDEIINSEQRELEMAFEENKNCPEVCFIEDALLQLKDRKEALYKKQFGLPSGINQEVNCVMTGPSTPEDLKVVSYVSAFDNEEADEAACQSQIDPTQEVSNELSEDGDRNVRGNAGATGKDVYYFYQSADGQHMYMHSLNVHMLIKEYGCLEHCPTKIVASVVEKESVSMNEDLRRRLRYLAHLPLTCDFEIVELNLTKPLVSESTLQAFNEDILKRKRKRNQRAKEENKRERQLQAMENYNMGKVAAAKISLGSYKHFPECGPLSSSPDNSPELSDVASSCQSPTPDVAVASSSGAGPSFAQMLREGKAKAGVNMKRVVATSLVGSALDDSDSDEERAAPAFKNSFCADLSDALDNYPTADLAESTVKGGRKKKNKHGKRLLFTTNVIRNK